MGILVPNAPTEAAEVVRGVQLGASISVLGPPMELAAVAAGRVQLWHLMKPAAVVGRCRRLGCWHIPVLGT